jgi:chromosome segregation ATPase
MGLGERLQSLIYRMFGKRNIKPRRSSLEKMRAEIRELRDARDAIERNRNEWKLRAEQAERQVESLEEQLLESRKQTRVAETNIEVLQVENEGQAKMIVAQQTFIDAATARASADVARITNGRGGSINAGALFNQD